MHAFHSNLQLSTQLPRYARGTTTFREYEIEYCDLKTVCYQWQSLFSQQILRFVAPSDTPRILDCGANHGLASLYFKQLYPNARITAYESDPHIYELCRANLSNNRAGDVDVVHAAIWDKNGSVVFCCEGSDSGYVASLPIPGVQGVSKPVPSVRFRDILAAEPVVDFIKIDIEGSELPVLRDCVDHLGNVRSLYIEMHEFEPAERMTAEILNLLARAGFAYKLGDFHCAMARQTPPLASDPFPGCYPAWVCGVWAWRTTNGVK